VFRWVRQDRIDRGEIEGIPTVESAQLRAARRRIAELEAELATVKRASELFEKGRVVRPKAVYPIVATLAAEGRGTKGVCRILGLAPSGFFRWRSKAPSDRAIRRAWLVEVITEIHVRSRGSYGWRRIRAELADSYRQIVNKKLIRSVMAELGITGLPTRRRRALAPTRQPDSLDLVNRDFARSGPDQLWMTDITEHPTREGILYCCVVLDAWSRRVVGWSIDRRPTAAMVNTALGMAIEARRPPPGALVHSDHGSQGGFKWPSQHLDHGGVAWRLCENGSGRCSCIGGRSRRLVLRRWRGVRTGSGFGWRSLAA
jgi:transposase-like protein